MDKGLSLSFFRTFFTFVLSTHYRTFHVTRDLCSLAWGMLLIGLPSAISSSPHSPPPRPSSSLSPSSSSSSSSTTPPPSSYSSSCWCCTPISTPPHLYPAYGSACPNFVSCKYRRTDSYVEILFTFQNITRQSRHASNLSVLMIRVQK